MEITRQASEHKPSLVWRRDGTAWLLLAGRRRLGRVVPDSDYSRMWRSTLPSGGLSDMANLSRAKNAVLQAALRELESEARHQTAIAPSKSQENEPVFRRASSLVRFSRPALTDHPGDRVALLEGTP